MDYDNCLRQIQDFLENSPLVILGSGASAAYGLPLMYQISDEIKKHSDKFSTDEYAELCNNLDNTNLEAAIDETSLCEVSLEVLRNIIWDYINKKDLEFSQSLSDDSSNFAIADLLGTLVSSASNTTTVVTTNYDRLAEYAADLIGTTTVTGFEGNLIRYFELPTTTIKNRRIKTRERIVNVWKVHGSLDWFLDKNSNIVSYPLPTNIPDGHTPLIIPPGKGKYSVTHHEPYRDIIKQADDAFSKAGSYLCIGYGFNDDHLQPWLIREIKNGKPIVVLCRTATDACKKNVISSDVKKYVVVERSTDSKTLVTGNGYSEVFDGDFWELSNFIKTIWR